MSGLPLGDNPRVLIYSVAETVEESCWKLPFARALRQAFPTGQLVWLAGQGRSGFRHELAPLIEPLIDVVIDEAGIGLRASELIGRPLGEERFDLVIDTGDVMMTALILKRIRARHFISAASEFKLSSVRPPKDHVPPTAPVARLLELLTLALGGPVEAVPPLNLDPSIENLAEDLLPDGHAFFLLIPGATKPGGAWPMQNFATVGRALAMAGRIPVLLLDDARAARKDELASSIPSALFPLQRARVHPLGARLDLITALARRCWVAVAEDCPGAHLAAAAGTPMVTLFGPTDPRERAPIASRQIPLDARDWQSRDVARIPPVAVLQAIEELAR